MNRRISLVACLLLASAAHAGQQRLVVTKGTVATALAELSAQTGISVSVENPSLWTRRVNGFAAPATPEAALRRILAGSGARLVKIGPAVYRAVLPQAPTRPARPAPAPIAPAAAAIDEDVVVTASKRELRMHELPAAVEIVDGAQLVADGERGTDSVVTRLASLSSTYLGAGRNKLFIRGVADSSFTGPTQGTVGQYLGDIRLTYNAPDPDLRLYDIGSVEVLEGPQGTLYGAGSLGGILRTNPNAPVLNQPAGVISTGLSATQHGAPGADLGGWINVPITDRSAMRLVGYGLTEGGYIDDILRRKRDINRTTTAGGRGSLLYEPGDQWRVQVGAVFQRNHGRDSQYADRDLPPLERASATPGGFNSSYWLTSLSVEKRWSDIRFQSSTGFVRHRLTEQYDATIDADPRLFIQRNHTSMFTTENRIWSPLRNGFGWVIGGSYTHNRTVLDRQFGKIDAPPPATGVTNMVDEVTAFAEASLQRSFLTFTGGIRLTHDRLTGSARDMTPALVDKLLLARITAKRTENNILPSAAVSARLGGRSIAFLRYQEGIRPGGLAVDDYYVRRFRGDHIRSVEAGLRFPENARSRISGGVSASFSRWTDIQADYVDSRGLPSTSNIGTGRIYSISGSLRVRPSSRFTIDMSGTYNDSRVTDPSAFFVQAMVNAVAPFDEVKAREISVQPLGRIPNVAKLTSRIAARYEIIRTEAALLTFEGWTRYVGRSRLGVGPVLGGNQGNYTETGLLARLATDQFVLTLGVTNLFDSVGNRFALGTPFARELSQTTPLRPRTVRFGVEHRF